MWRSLAPLHYLRSFRAPSEGLGDYRDATRALADAGLQQPDLMTRGRKAGTGGQQTHLTQLTGMTSLLGTNGCTSTNIGQVAFARGALGLGNVHLDADQQGFKVP